MQISQSRTFGRQEAEALQFEAPGVLAVAVLLGAATAWPVSAALPAQGHSKFCQHQCSMLHIFCFTAMPCLGGQELKHAGHPLVHVQLLPR